MKQRIINGNILEFFNSNNLQKAEIRVSGSDIIINPLDTGGKVILGDTGSVNDLEIGEVGAPVSFTFLGGGTLTSNSSTLVIGNTGDTLDLSKATIGPITASAFVGDGSKLTGIVPDLSEYLGDANITGSIRVSNNVFLDGIINQDTPQNHVVTFNNTTGQLFITASSAFGGGGGGGSEPGGETSTIQYNNAGVLDGDDNFKFESSISTVLLTGSLISTGNIIGTLIDLDSTGSARITGSLDLEGPLNITGSSDVDALKVSIPDGNGSDEKLIVNNEGVLVLANLVTSPTAITGGLFYSSSNLFLGID